MPHDNAQPLNEAILSRVRKLFPATPLMVYQPRASVAYELPHHTALHAGFGLFSDIIPAQIADLASTNAPYAPTFVAGSADRSRARPSFLVFQEAPSMPCLPPTLRCSKALRTALRRARA